MFEQILIYSEFFLSQYLNSGFWEGYKTQQISREMQISLDKKGFTGAILMDLSKAFYCLNHELLIAKLSAYGFSRSALKSVHSYLNQRQQRVKVNGSFSNSKWTSLGVPQGSVLGPLLFKLDINDLFYLLKKILRFATTEMTLLSLRVLFKYGLNRRIN